jgi:hypothetical protein
VGGGGGWQCFNKNLMHCEDSTVNFFGPKLHSPNGSMPFTGPKKVSISKANPLPVVLVMDLPASKPLRPGRMS